MGKYIFISILAVYILYLTVTSIEILNGYTKVASVHNQQIEDVLGGV